MEIAPQYAAKLFFSNPAFIQIYFEAIANALDAESTDIHIHIATDGKISPQFLNISISDNGEGFTDERFARFKKLVEPQDEFHKGLGRLVFLNYFSKVEVDSVYGEFGRAFTFDNSFDGKSKVSPSVQGQNSGSTLRFNHFFKERLKSYDDLKPGALKGAIIEHFLPRFYELKKLGASFRITLELETKDSNEKKDFFPDTQTITTDDIPEFQVVAFKDEAIDTYSEIRISYFIRSGMGERTCLTAACIDGRTISLPLLNGNSIPLNYSAMFLFESDLFAGNSDSARQRLVLSDTISETTLYRVLRREISKILSQEIPEVEKKNAETRENFESRYPHLSGYFDEHTVGIIDKDDAIETAQRSFFKDQKQILESDALDDATFEKSLEVSSRTLTEYILYRELIIKRLRSISKEDCETVVHNLIVPQRQRYGEDTMLNEIYNNNAWLLDDKFMTFRTILSETKMNEVVSAITKEEKNEGGDGRPDISMIFSADPHQEEMVDVVIVELKRKTDSVKENTYASTQLLQRARNLVDHCPKIQRAWYFAVIEIDDKLDQFLQDDEWTPLYSKGRVYYRERKLTRADGFVVPVPICLLSFDSVIDDAAARNHTFLEILKNDLKKATEAKTKDAQNTETTENDETEHDHFHTD